ncbi:MAG: hypothetical protein ACYS8X_09435 [Planctomycetota bacterium]|jgi:hypothetical protein
MKGAHHFLLSLMLCVVLPAGWVAGDALIVTKAMTASTIVEMFITDESIRVELEIGVADLKAFGNIMPDELYEKLGNDPKPLVERVGAFFKQDWTLRVDGDQPLVGRITTMASRRRLARDEVTGEPLPNQPEDAELVVCAEIVYPLKDRPTTLTIRPPMQPGSGFVAANIGFVVYHQELPVNDFRYLGGEETLDLDWADPWYSSFRNRNLRRQYFSPIQAFIYVDSFEVRKEIIVRPKDLQQWVDLGLAGKTTIPVDEQPALKQRVAEFLIDKCPVQIDGKDAAPVPALTRVNFVRRSLRKTGIVDPPQELPEVSATLGVIFTYPVDDLPQEVTMRWKLFSPRVQQIPTVATDEAGGLPYTVSADDPVLTWQNFLKNPTKPTLVTISPPQHARLSIPIITAVCAILLVWTVLRSVGSSNGQKTVIRRALPLAAGLVICGLASLPVARISMANPFVGFGSVSDEKASTVISALLKNIYHAFDYRDEGAIYDTLERSTTGELLTQVYLETRKALEIRNSGGVRTKVKDVELLSVDPTDLSGEAGFTARCTWNVTGSIGHWGHIHQRTNQYKAQFTIKPVDGAWRIVDLELLQETRL